MQSIIHCNAEEEKEMTLMRNALKYYRNRERIDLKTGSSTLSIILSLQEKVGKEVKAAEAINSGAMYIRSEESVFDVLLKQNHQ